MDLEWGQQGEGEAERDNESVHEVSAILCGERSASVVYSLTLSAFSPSSSASLLGLGLGVTRLPSSISLPHHKTQNKTNKQTKTKQTNKQTKKVTYSLTLSAFSPSSSASMLGLGLGVTAPSPSSISFSSRECRVRSARVVMAG
jgi:hypothetical protein